MSIPLESRWIGANLGCSQIPSLRFKNITTDSRKVTQGSLFVAIPGDQHDGHAFIEQAVYAGATGVLAQSGKVPAAVLKNSNLAIFEVPDTTEAFRKIAGVWRRSFQIPMIVVAGSVGKTTTKELLTAILRGHFPSVVSTQGSQNGFLGIPMTLFEITSETSAAVIEVGIDDVGAMERHINLVQPTFSLLTAIAEEHLEKLIDLPTVAREERLALTLTHDQGGTVLIRMDDPWIRTVKKVLNVEDRVFTCSLEKDEESGHHFRGSYDPKRNTLRIRLSGGSSFEMISPLPGSHNATNLLTAISAALALGLTPMEIQRGLQTFRGAAGRSELQTFPDGTEVICDYYNANPASVEAGLDLLAELREQRAQAKHSWVALGDMLELGTLEEELHRNLGSKLEKVRPDGIFLYGKRMKWLEDELKKRGFSGVLSHHDTHAALADSMKNHIQAGDLVLVKGSRGMKMEEVYKRLRGPTKS